jgi:hypothetical protein
VIHDLAFYCGSKISDVLILCSEHYAQFTATIMQDGDEFYLPHDENKLLSGMASCSFTEFSLIRLPKLMRNIKE